MIILRTKQNTCLLTKPVSKYTKNMNERANTIHSTNHTTGVTEPVGTNIFVFFLSMLIGAISGWTLAFATLSTLRVSALIHNIVLYTAGLPLGILAGAYYGYKLGLRPAILHLKEKRARHSGANTLENRANPKTAKHYLKLQETSAPKKITFGKVLLDTFYISAYFAFGLFCISGFVISMLKPALISNVFIFGCFTYSIATIIVVSLIRHIPIKRYERLKFENAASAEGIVHDYQKTSVAIRDGLYKYIYYKIWIAVSGVNQFLIAYAESNINYMFECPYEKGEKVTVEYDAAKPKRCKITQVRI